MKNKTKQLWYLKNRARLLPKFKAYALEHSQERKAYRKEYYSKKGKIDSIYRIKQALRRRINHALRGTSKSAPTFTLLGCPIDIFRAHLEKQFKPGMSWSNYGKWHIDHIRPCASFDLSKQEEQKKCFHYTNLQPLWALDNLHKSSRILIEVTYAK
jgi:DNA/RNA endonuclease G (NUC1)